MTLNVMCENYPTVHKKTLIVDLTCPKECNKVTLVQFADTAYYGVLPFTSVDRLECFFKQKCSDQLIVDSPPEISVGRS